MWWCRSSEDQIVISLLLSSLKLLLLISLGPKTTDAGASSTPKNLVNLYTNSPNDNSNLTGSPLLLLSSSSPSQFQNEYQFHQGLGKPADQERFKTSSATQSSDPVLDHVTSEWNNDYSYQENRGSPNISDSGEHLNSNGSRVSACADIDTCDRCLTNQKCGWLNDINNTGKGKCIEGASAGPAFASGIIGDSTESSNTTVNSSLISISPPILPNWFYTNCPLCQCNGHSYCKQNSSLCLQPCQDNTEGPHCDRCIPGYFGEPMNGGSCRPCRCNGHAQSCQRDTGKCHCATKGIIGHSCNRCDDQNHYLGDPSTPNNGTCYYNLTTDYQYTFNMSKPEDHYHSYINFINVPIRRDSDVDFTIACSRLALVNITSGTSYKNRTPLHASLECGSFRLRFPHERLISSDANYSFFVHVYKFHTPFILQIAFSQHRTLYLPQFFFTFSSSFLFFFALSGLVWKLKHEYDLYVRRQRQFIEMEQMASRPFATILLEILKPPPDKLLVNELAKRTSEPTPISFEPCFGSNVGVMSFFVQLPGRPNLAIGSALISLNDDSSNSCDENQAGKHHEKETSTSAKNL